MHHGIIILGRGGIANTPLSVPVQMRSAESEAKG